MEREAPCLTFLPAEVSGCVCFVRYCAGEVLGIVPIISEAGSSGIRGTGRLLPRLQSTQAVVEDRAEVVVKGLKDLPQKLFEQSRPFQQS